MRYGSAGTSKQRNHLLDVSQRFVDPAKLAVVLCQEAEHPLRTAPRCVTSADWRGERGWQGRTTITVGASHSDEPGNVLDARSDARIPSKTVSMMATCARRCPSALRARRGEQRASYFRFISVEGLQIGKQRRNAPPKIALHVRTQPGRELVSCLPTDRRLQLAFGKGTVGWDCSPLTRARAMR